MATLAEAAVEIIAELDKFEPDLRRKLTAAVQSAADDAEKEFRKAGQKSGRAFSEATAKAASDAATDPRFEAAGRVAGSQFAGGFTDRNSSALKAVQGQFVQAGTAAGTGFGDAVEMAAAQSSNSLDKLNGDIRRVEQSILKAADAQVDAADRIREAEANLARVRRTTSTVTLDGAEKIAAADAKLAKARREATRADEAAAAVARSLGDAQQAASQGAIRAAEAVAAATRRSGIDQQNAIEKVRLAELRLAEVRSNSKSSASSLLSAENGLSAARARAAELGADAGDKFSEALRRVVSRDSDRVGKEAGGFFSRAFQTAAARAVGGGLLQTFAASIAALVSAASPLGSVIGGGAAAIVALAAAIGQAAGAALALPGILGAIGLAAATVKIATGGLEDAFKAQSKALQELAVDGKVSEKTQKDLAAAMKGLAPAAREVVTAVGAQAGAFRQLRTQLQENLFAGIGASITQIATRFLPILTQGLGRTATLLNRAATGFATFITSGEQSQRIFTIIGSLNRILQALLPSIIPLVDGFLTLFQASLPFAAQLAAIIAGLAVKFQAFATGVVASGEFKTFMQGAFVAARELFGVLGNLAGIIGTIFAAGSETGVGLLSVINDLLGKFREFLASADGQQGLQSFFGLIGAAGSALTGIFSTLKPLLAGVAAVFTALEGPIRQLGVALTPIIGQLAISLGAALQTLAPVLASIVTSVTPLVSGILAGLVAVFQALLTAVLPLVPPIALFVQQLVAGLLPILPTIVAVLLTLVEAAGTFLAALLPLVPSLLQMVAASLQFAAALASVLLAIAPLITLLAQFTAGGIALIAPVLIFAAQSVAAFTTAIAGAVTAIGGFIARVVDFVVQFLSQFNSLKSAGGAILSAFVAGTRAAFSALLSAGLSITRSLVSGILALLGSLLSGAVARARAIATGFTNALRTGVQAAVALFRALPGQIVGALSGLAGQLAAAGSNAINGLVGGLEKGLQRVRDVAGKIAGAITGPVGKLLEIGSPSKVMHRVGDDTVQGLINGLREKIPALRAALGTLARAIPTEVEGAVAKVNTALNGIAKGLSSTQRTQLNTLIATARTGIDVIQRAQAGVDQRLKASQATLKTLLDQAQQFATSVANTILQSGNITQGTDGGFAGIVTKLKEAVTNARAFETVLAKLGAAGLNKTLLQQIAEAGPEAGLASGQAILAAGRAGIAQVNKLQNQLTQAANRAATAAAQALFGQGIQVARGIVAGLQSQAKALNAQMIRLADVLVARVIALLRNVKGIGKLSIPGFANGGLATSPSIFGEAGAEVAIPLTRPRRRDELLEKYFGGWADARTPMAGGGRTKEVHMPINVTGLSKDETVQVVRSAIASRLGTSVGIVTSIGPI